MLWPLKKKTRDALVIFSSYKTMILEAMKWEVKPMEDRVMMKRGGISNVLEYFKIRKLCHRDFDNNLTSLTTITSTTIFYNHTRPIHDTVGTRISYLIGCIKNITTLLTQSLFPFSNSCISLFFSFLNYGLAHY